MGPACVLSLADSKSLENRVLFFLVLEAPGILPVAGWVESPSFLWLSRVQAGSGMERWDRETAGKWFFGKFYARLIGVWIDMAETQGNNS